MSGFEKLTRPQVKHQMFNPDISLPEEITMFRSRECNLHLSIITGNWSGFLSLKSVRLKTGAGGSIQSFSPNDRLVGFFKRPSRGNFDPVRFYLKACGVPLSEIAPEMNKYLAWNPKEKPVFTFQNWFLLSQLRAHEGSSVQCCPKVTSQLGENERIVKSQAGHCISFSGKQLNL